MRRTLLALVLFVALVGDGKGQAHVTKGPIADDGTELPLDLPPALHMRNTGGMGRGGPGTGAGLCVFTSIEHSARWQNIPELFGWQKWMTRKPGGGWPEKVTQMSAAYCREQGVPPPDLIQIESGDLEPLRLAVRTGRMPGVTYAYSPTGRYGGRRIAHMVTLVSAGAGKGPDGRGWWAILDNNYPGSFEWMSESQFMRTYTGGGRMGWAVIPRNPAPPPVPVPRKESTMNAAAFLVLAVTGLALDQWGTVDCGPVGSNAFVPISGPVWKHTGPGRNQANLFLRGSWRGAWFHDSGKYHPWDGTRFLDPAPCPVDPPHDPLLSEAPTAAENFGVDFGRIGPKEQATIGGQVVPMAQVLAELRRGIGDGPPDDSGLNHLTLVAQDPALAKDLRTAAAAGGLGEWAAKKRVQVYDWSREIDRTMLAPFKLDQDKEFQEKGTVAFCQKPAEKGKAQVLDALYGFGSLDQVVSWLRRPDPNWDPNKSRPKGPGPAGPGGGQVEAAGYYLTAGLGGLALLLLVSKGRRSDD